VSLLTHSIPVEIQRLQCIISKQALANNTFWRLACVVDLVGANSLCAIKNNPREVSVSTGHWLATKHLLLGSHSHQLPFITCASYKNK
jgi:hypothetical protein